MARKKEKQYEESVMDSIKDLMNDRNSYYSRDNSDLDSARSVLSGFGFDSKDREYRGNKPEITVPVIQNWMNQVVSAYTSAPFGLQLVSKQADITPHRLVWEDITKNITEIAAKALREELGVGYTYALVTNEIEDASMNWQKPVIKLLDARKVVIGYCEDPELDDLDIAIVIDVISKSKAKEKFGLDDYDLRGNKDVLTGYDVIMDSRTQCSVVTCYERIAEGVRISKIVYDRVIDQQILPLTRLPLIRFYGDESWIEKEVHYRGVYSVVSDMWKVINYGVSEVQARIATAPTANYIVDPKAIADNSEAWETGSESAVLPASSWDAEKQLNAPIPVDKNPQIDGIMNGINTMFTWVSTVLGSPTTESRQNETAEAVLARKSTAEATVNKYLNNLKNSLRSLGKVLLEMMAIAYDVPRVLENGQQIPALSNIDGITIEVSDGPIQKSQRQQNLQQVLAFYGLAKESNPQAFSVVGPAILASSDMPVDIKQAMAPLFAQNPQQNLSMMQQQMQQMTQQNQQTMAENDDLKKNLAQLQIQLNEFVDDSEIKLQIAKMDNETKIYLKQMELAASNEELQTKLRAQFAESQQKLANELTKKRLELQSKVETPVFSSTRTFV